MQCVDFVNLRITQFKTIQLKLQLYLRKWILFPPEAKRESDNGTKKHCLYSQWRPRGNICPNVNRRRVCLLSWHIGASRRLIPSISWQKVTSFVASDVYKTKDEKRATIKMLLDIFVYFPAPSRFVNVIKEGVDIINYTLCVDQREKCL